MKYADWLKDFVRDKRFVAILDQSTAEAVHDIHRYLDAQGRFWETAVTYTGKVVIRSGTTGSTVDTIDWDPWITLHDIEPPEGHSP